jgi:hypothetical protein
MYMYVLPLCASGLQYKHVYTIRCIWLAKGESDTARVRRGGLAAATICSQSSGKIHHIASYPIVRHIVRPPVATYGSCFLTCLVISLKKPHKG